MPSGEDLRKMLRRLDGRGYKNYRDVRDTFDFGFVSLSIDRVQADPFAAPSWVRLRCGLPQTHVPRALFSNRVRKLAFSDFLARRAEALLRPASGSRRGSGRSGVMAVDAGGQEVIERTAVKITADFVELRLEVGLPAAGRRVLGRAAESLLCDELPELARRSLFWDAMEHDAAHAFVDTVENQEHIRTQLSLRRLIAFVGDGASLPRVSGASDRPLATERAVRFDSPGSLRVHLELRNPVEGPDGPRDHVAGMGIPEGVTLIVGGGYHGKSTLLRAIERGVYPHVPGDGREWVVSRSDLVKVRAEDGRRVECVDIGGFVRDLPGGGSTRTFSSDDASGSTSQASSIVEAIEVGARGLLLDEDTSASNFLVRDARMQALVHREHEPITPFVDRVRELYEALGVSTVMVMGGSGDYFDVADTVLRLRDYRAEDVTAKARAIALQQPTGRTRESGTALSGVTPRSPRADSFDPSRGRREVRIDAPATNRLRFGRDDIDLAGVEQVVDPSQTRAIGAAIHLAAKRFMADDATLDDVLDRLDALLDTEGLDVLDPFHIPGRNPGRFARPRRYEIAAAINRLRSLRVLAGG